MRPEDLKAQVSFFPVFVLFLSLFSSRFIFIFIFLL